MDEQILIRLGQNVRRHPWWRARARLTLALLDCLDIHPPATILDAGCGWGTTLDALEYRGYRAIGLDISRHTLETLDQPGRILVEADLTQPLPDGLNPFDAVLALDVIEHIDDDGDALARLGTLVRSGGYLIVSVPARPDLFSEFDVIQGHRRRYMPETLRSAFHRSGLHVDSIFWWGRWMIPVLMQQRRKPKSRNSETHSQIYERYLQLPPWPVTWLIQVAFALEQSRALKRRLNTGTSLFGVARRG